MTDLSIKRAVSLNTLAGIDTEAGLKRLSNNIDLYLKLLNYYQRDYQNILEHIQQLYTQQSWPELKKLAHTIKGESANLSIDTVSQLAASLEQACINQHYETIPEIISQLQTQLAVVIASIKHLAETNQAKPGSSANDITMRVDSTQIKRLLEKTLKYLDINVNKVDQCVDDIKALYQGHELPDNIQILEEYIFNFKKDEAKSLIKKLILKE